MYITLKLESVSYNALSFYVLQWIDIWGMEEYCLYVSPPKVIGHIAAQLFFGCINKEGIYYLKTSERKKKIIIWVIPIQCQLKVFEHVEGYF